MNYVNQIIGGKYKILSLIGSGSFGCVYKVKDIHIDKIFAAKQFAGMHEHFQLELNNLKKIQNKGVPKLVDGFTEDGKDWIVMEYFNGTTLKEYCQKEGGIKEPVRRKIITELLEILASLHDMPVPVVYGDLKPENIIIDSSKNVCLIDMGSADTIFNYKKEKMLTKEYASPEQLNGKTLPQSDIYALGKLIFYMGKNQSMDFYQGQMNEKRLLNLGFSKQEAILIINSIHPDYRKRYENGREMLKEWEKKRFYPKKIVCNLISFCLILMEICGIIFSTLGMVQYLYSQIEDGIFYLSIGIGLLLIVYLIQKFVFHPEKYDCIQESFLLISGKQEVGLGFIILLCSLSILFQNGKDNLWVEIKEQNGKSVMIKEGCELQASHDLFCYIHNNNVEVSVNGARYKPVKDKIVILPIDKMKNGEVMIFQFREKPVFTETFQTMTFRVQKNKLL